MSPRLRAGTCALLLLALGGLARAGGPAPEQAWTLRPAEDGDVVYHGVVNLDRAGIGPGGMLYPVPGVGGLVAAVIAHGVIAKGARDAEKTRLQDQADQVLGPLREQVAGFRTTELVTRGLSLMSAPAPVTEGGWVVLTKPVFALHQDGRTLALDNELSFFPPGERDKPDHTLVARVLSATPPGPAQDGATAPPLALKDESARLLARSVEVGLRDARRSGTAALPFRSVRYLEGDAERIERGQVLECPPGRIVLRNLRGWIVSAPVQPDAEMESLGCPAQAAH